MRILEEQFAGGLVINVFHNRTQYLFRYRKTWLSIFYRPGVGFDVTGSASPVPARRIRSVVSKAARSRRAKMWNLFHAPVMQFFENRSNSKGAKL
jgi:hypothetical protein